MNLHKAMMG